MNCSFRLLAAALLPFLAYSQAPPAVPALEGPWKATLQAGPRQYHLLLHVSKEAGEWKATLDSLDQGTVGLPVKTITFTSPAVHFEMPAIGVTFDGTLDHDSIKGTFTQGGTPLPLTFERTTLDPVKPKLNEELWRGSIPAPSGAINMILHIWNEDDGKSAGSMEVPSQGLAAILLTDVTRNEEKFTFSMKGLGATYEGLFDSAHKTLTGTLSQAGQKVPVSFLKTDEIKSTAAPASLEGIWEGPLRVDAATLRVTAHFSKDANGALAGTLDSIDLNLKDVPLTAVSLQDTAVHFEAKTIKSTFDGKLTSDRVSIGGTWSQGPASLPLALKKVEKATEIRRPQMPVRPLPYKEEEVSFNNPLAEGVVLAGTLTLPKGPGPFPAVLLITGSGPQDRDETIMGHKPFLVLSDALTRKGIAVLRVDDRGVAKSTGKFAGANTATFATDAATAVGFLKSRKEIDPKKIGLIGHSEGGVIAPMLASSSTDIAFIILMAGTGLSGSEILPRQVAAMTRASGAPEEAVKRAEELQRKVMQAILDEPDNDKAAEKIVAIIGPNPQIPTLLGPWYRYFLKYDPQVTLEKVKVPVLALNGEKDLQVPAKENLEAIREALEKGGNKNVRIVSLPNLNHLFQTAQTGLVTEYGSIEETIAPQVLDIISAWILEVTSRPTATSQQAAK